MEVDISLSYKTEVDHQLPPREFAFIIHVRKHACANGWYFREHISCVFLDMVASII